MQTFTPLDNESHSFSWSCNDSEAPLVVDVTVKRSCGCIGQSGFTFLCHGCALKQSQLVYEKTEVPFIID